MSREAMEFDVVIVGGGPAGLAAAIRLKQQSREQGREFSVCLIDKGSEIGAHILSGAVMDPRALDELLPNWRDSGLSTPVSAERFLWLGQNGATRIPSFLLPDCLDNAGNHIVSLGALCRWLARQAEALGVEIYAGFAGAEILFDESGAVTGVITDDKGRLRDGSEGPNFEPGIELRGKYTLFAEGCRGHLGKRLMAHYGLDQDAAPQSYSLGFKEIWEVPADRHQPGLIVHSSGWPLDSQTQGGGFLYHPDQGRVVVGLVVGLDYRNPYLSPFDEFQRYKTHPAIRAFLAGGKRIAYGARAIVSGGLPSLPQLVFPGGCLIGDDAGFLNPARLKGVHAAIKSAMLAAEACFDALLAGRAHDALTAYPDAFANSWLHAELHRTRNFKPLMQFGQKLGALAVGVDQILLRGRAPWTLRRTQPDHLALKPASACAPIAYARPDGVLSFDKMSSVHLSNTHHQENQPCHLRLRDPALPIAVNLPLYDAPEQRYCPAGVYEIIAPADAAPRLQINAQNCIHCKTCDIKDPRQNIEWVPAQGGEGPNYANM